MNFASLTLAFQQELLDTNFEFETGKVIATKNQIRDLRSGLTYGEDNYSNL